MQGYSIKFTTLSKYVPSFVSNLGDDMNCFVMGVSDGLIEECRSAKLYDNMDISSLMSHDQKVEDTRLKRKNREFKGLKLYERGTSKGRL